MNLQTRDKTGVEIVRLRLSKKKIFYFVLPRSVKNSPVMTTVIMKKINLIIEFMINTSKHKFVLSLRNGLEDRKEILSDQVSNYLKVSNKFSGLLQRN
jgi:hypothetical protein